MIIDDDRSDAQKLTHTSIVAATDRAMSGWGKAANGRSCVGWACEPKHEKRVMEWVERRGDMKRVRIVGGDWKPSGTGHTHIYVVNDNHPSLAAYMAYAASMDRAAALAKA